MGDDAALAACKDAFAAQNIPWTILEHEPVLTVEAGLEAVKSLQCSFAKNLFVKDKKAGLFLLAVTHDRKVDMKKLPQWIEEEQLGKGDERTLNEEGKTVFRGANGGLRGW